MQRRLVASASTHKCTTSIYDKTCYARCGDKIRDADVDAVDEIARLGESAQMHRDVSSVLTGSSVRYGSGEIMISFLYSAWKLVV